MIVHSEEQAETVVRIDTHRCRGLLFDMDGVLVSSIESVERAWGRWALEHNIDRDEMMRTLHGRRAVDVLRQWGAGLDEQAEHKKIEDWEVEDNSDLKVLPGVKNLLSKLPLENWTIVTSATERLARARLIAGGLTVPDRFVNANMVVNGKPHPEPYIRGAELLGFAPNECVVVEDAPAGVRAGKAAGARVLATTFSHKAEELSDADWIVSSLDDLTVKVVDGGLELEMKLLGH